jgi:hypothetical protein
MSVDNLNLIKNELMLYRLSQQVRDLKRDKFEVLLNAYHHSHSELAVKADIKPVIFSNLNPSPLNISTKTPSIKNDKAPEPELNKGHKPK